MEEILDKIADVFRRHGYEGATLSRLSKATGLKRASLYHHFPDGKADMARAVATHLSQKSATLVQAPLKAEGSSRERLEGFAKGIIEFYGGGTKNCFMAAMILSGGHNVLADQMRRAFMAWIDAIRTVLVSQGAPEQLAQDRARMAVERIQGALIVARPTNDVAAFQRSVLGLPDLLLDGLE